MASLFEVNLTCPHCAARITLREARRDVPLPEQSTWRKRVLLEFTTCPACGRDFWVEGERFAAFVTLLSYFAVISLTFVTGSWLFVAAGLLVVVLGPKITQLLVTVRREAPPPSPR